MRKENNKETNLDGSKPKTIMQIDIDTIIPLKGFADINFGSTEKEVIETISSPLHRTMNEEGDINIVFKELLLRFTFHKDYNHRLSLISTERDTLILCQNNLYGKTKHAVKQFISNTLESVITEEDECFHEDGSIQEWIDLKNQGLSFWFSNDALYLVDLFCE